MEVVRIPVGDGFVAQELEEGQVRMGVVKNIADFGVFVDLGGIDGLLHITDMSWGRVNHPSEMVKLDDEVEVKVLKIDRERERIALGMAHDVEVPHMAPSLDLPRDLDTAAGKPLGIAPRRVPAALVPLVEVA